jgi:hypothetical protein
MGRPSGSPCCAVDISEPTSVPWRVDPAGRTRHRLTLSAKDRSRPWRPAARHNAMERREMGRQILAVKDSRHRSLLANCSTPHFVVYARGEGPCLGLRRGVTRKLRINSRTWTGVDHTFQRAGSVSPGDMTQVGGTRNAAQECASHRVLLARRAPGRLRPQSQ